MTKSRIDWFSEPNMVSGWINDDGNKVKIEIEKNGHIIGTGQNNHPRPDLESAGLGACAFTIKTTEPFSYYDILSGHIKVFYKKNSVENKIEIESDVIKSIKFKVLSHLLKDFQNIDPKELEVYIYNERKHISDSIYYAEIAALSSLNNNQIPFPQHKDIHKNISPFYIKVGTTSPDLRCEVGTNGHLFLTGGSNNVLDIYERKYNSNEIAQTSEKWVNLFKERLDFCHDVGARFIEVIIPDKLSVLREQYDGMGSAPSPLLSMLELKIAENNLSDHYVSGLQAIEKISFTNAFRKIDTHFYPMGAHAVFKDICRKISPSYNVPAQFNIDYITTGDIGKRFFGQDLYEICTQSPHPIFHNGREILEHIAPPPGKFTGGHTIFKNDKAPFIKKVIGFGNSFMNGHVSQSSLGYWFSTFFQEFHLIIQSDIDKNYVRNINPDIVIGQTVERFLEFVPKT
ncbi:MULTISPECIES: hypothetical protein [Acetobacter]|uniref:AlgX/AlgJ SGNH hydrolase-like domain-containing protein n=4 Tax=Acetobacter TaxID=434 RepID=A0AAN1PH17_9PROT|nr:MULTISPECIES: hypothetical protein [Acetobacter]AXM99973.1 hypothetical protein CJF59_05000 [Acetobacter pomorum]KAA8392875.1 hypothetical protein FKW19_14590 [Acetobacter sp. DmW_125128]KAA8395729.1 hypothetical protein FKW20_11810 [Acetobacter sp. DmW_125127]KAA8401993.1 hypothetical protein FKW15_13370 [Acetobacter sp. DmW_125133]KAA8403301.1 hypothetical protein FKW24_11585 [Acetobacter sp. DmW_125134]